MPGQVRPRWRVAAPLRPASTSVSRRRTALQGSGFGVTLGVAGDIDNDLVVPPDTRAVSTALSLHGVDSSEAMYIRDISHLGR